MWTIFLFDSLKWVKCYHSEVATRNKILKYFCPTWASYPRNIYRITLVSHMSIGTVARYLKVLSYKDGRVVWAVCYQHLQVIVWLFLQTVVLLFILLIVFRVPIRFKRIVTKFKFFSYSTNVGSSYNSRRKVCWKKTKKRETCSLNTHF